MDKISTHPFKAVLCISAALFFSFYQATGQTTYIDEDFDGGMPGSWTIDDGGSSNDTWFQTSDKNGDDLDGTPFAFVDSDAAGGLGVTETLNEDLTTPSFDGTTEPFVFLEFDHFYENLGPAYDTARIEVYDGTSWNTVYEEYSGSVGSWANPAHEQIDITSYADPNMQVRFHYSDGGEWAWYWAVDNVHIYGESCSAPSNLNASGLNADSIEISWTSGGIGSEWEVEYGQAGFTPGTGNTFTTTENPDTVTGLSSKAGVNFEFYVREICGSGDTSAWNGPVDATIPCYEPLQAPLIETFTSTSMPPHCWSEDLVEGSGWELGQNGDPDFAAENVDEHTGNSGHFAWVDFDNEDDTTYLVSPKVDVSGMTEYPQVLYWFYSFNDDSQGNNSLELQAYDGTSWVTVQSHQQNDPEWVRTTADLSSYTYNDTLRIRIGAIADGGMSGDPNHNDLLLDDINIREAPSCPQPIDLDATVLSDDSVALSWTSNASGSEWEIEYGPSGFNPGDGTTQISSNATDTLTGLAPAKDYDVFVREVCSAGDTSSWSTPDEFVTLCATSYTATYSSGFDVTTTGTPLCWSEVDDPNDPVEVVSSTDNGHDPASSPQMVEISDGFLDQGDTAMLISPKFTDLSDGDKRIRFKARKEEASWQDSLLIGTVHDSGDGGSWTPYHTIYNEELSDEEWRTYTLNFNDMGAIGSNEHIAFLHGKGTYELYIDDFVYELSPVNDAGVASIEEPPAIPSCPQDSMRVEVEVKNYGRDPISNFDVAYTIDGGTPVVENFDQTLQPDSSATFYFDTTTAFNSVGTYQVKAYTMLSNDTSSYNDTAEVNASKEAGSMTPSNGNAVSIGPFGLEESTNFICGAERDYGCSRILTLNIDSLEHEYALNTVEMQLVSPEGTPLNLWIQLGSTANVIMEDLTFTDTASTSITNFTGDTVSGAYRPQEAVGFDKFEGERLNGEWKLRIYNGDFSASLDLNGWNMRAVEPEPPEPDLGPDTTVCREQNIILDPGQDPDWSYRWDDNSTNSTRPVAVSFLDTAQANLFHVTVTDQEPLNGCSIGDSIEVNVEDCTSLEEDRAGSISFEVHPNPADQRVFIESDANSGRFRYELLDLQGRTVASKSSEAQDRSTLDVSDLSQGVYILKGYGGRNDEELFQEKLIVE